MRIRLYAIPYAGGTSRAFDVIRPYLSEKYDLFSIELAGKGNRAREGNYEHYQEAVDDVVEIICKDSYEGPIALFGYSMGSLLAFDAVRILETLYHKKIEFLVVAANIAPSLPQKEFRLWEYDEKSFLDKLIEIEGMPEQILRNKRFLDIYLKVLKEDYYLIGERKSKLDTTQVAAPILALGGTEDELYNSVDGWKKHTRSLFCYQMIEGKHFFIKNNPMLVAEQINKMGVEINDES